MKKSITFLLLLLAVLGQGLHAQTTQPVKAEPLELRYLYFNPLSAGPEFYSQMIMNHAWILAQKEAWETELKKDKRSERNWENYIFAYDVALVEEKDSSRKLNLQKERKSLLKEMKRRVGGTRFYYQYLQGQTTDRRERDALQQKISSLKRVSERDYIADMDYYHTNRQMDRIEELAREWYESGLYSSNLLYYCYNELVGLKENAVFASDTNLGTYYRYLLQYGMGLFKDVEIVDPSDLTKPDGDREFWKKRKVDTRTLPAVDVEKMRLPGAWYLEQKEKRPVYFSQLIGGAGLLDFLKDNLYSEGLVFRYSSKPYNNMAAMRKNYEQNYLLDYIRRPLFKYNSFIGDGVFFQTNYVVGFASLLQFYKTSGDKNQYARLKSLLQSILDHFGNDQHLLSKEIIEGRKLVEAVMACVMEAKDAKEHGTIHHTTQPRDLKEEYQKLIDPEEP